MEEAQDSPQIVAELRKNRILKQKQHQEFNRSRAFDKDRFLESETVSEQDISGLCSRIKRRKHATDEDLRKLANAFLQSEANISAFIKVTGAINVVVKEFTGNDQGQRLLAAQCLCNLSLGDEICCSKIATFAGSYLMIFLLDSSDVSLSKICLWTTQNIIASGAKALNILMSQELLKNCLHIVNNSVDLEKDGIQLLDLIVESKWNELEDEIKIQVEKAVLKVMTKNPYDTMTLQVFYRILSLNQCWGLTQEEGAELTYAMTWNMISNRAKDEALYFTIRILTFAFKQNEANIQTSLEMLIKYNVKLVNLADSSAENPKYFTLVRPLMDLIAILYTNSQPIVKNYLDLDSPVFLKIPKIFEF